MKEKIENKEQLKKFLNDRYLELEDEPYFPLDSYCTVTYRCQFHKNKIQIDKWGNIKNNVGCYLCKYPMSRIEAIFYLGCKDAIHKYKVGKTEFNIYLPENKVITFYNEKNEQTEKINKLREKVAKENNLKLFTIYENNKDELNKEGNIITIPNYSKASEDKKKEIGIFLEQYFPFKWDENLWDKATIYMREWAKKEYEKRIEKEDIKEYPIRRYDRNYKIIGKYHNLDEIIKEIKTGDALGSYWEIYE